MENRPFPIAGSAAQLPRLSAFVTLEELNLSAQSRSCLQRAGLRTAADILRVSRDALSLADGIAQEHVSEIIRALAALGYDYEGIQSNRFSKPIPLSALNIEPVPCGVCAGDREEILLISGRRVSVSPLCINGVFFPMGHLFERFDSILFETAPEWQLYLMTMALREETCWMTGSRMLLNLEESRRLIEQSLSCGFLPSSITGDEQCIFAGKTMLSGLRAGGRLDAPALGELGKAGEQVVRTHCTAGKNML